MASPFNHKIRIVNTDWAVLLGWLIENVGVLLHSQPIVFWHGEGWHLNSGSRAVTSSNPAQTKVTHEFYLDVHFEREEDAVLCSLKWL